VIELDTTQREARAREVRHGLVATLIVGAHLTFRGVFAFQWVVAIALAWKSSLPGEPRILFTMIVGAMLSVPALLFARAAPQSAWVRHYMASCQIGWSILFMWLLEGQPESQLHVFISLAFISFYRDYRVLVTATVIAIAYPIVRLALLPDSYLIGAAAWWRVFDLAVWVFADAVIMLIAVWQSLKTLHKYSTHSATLSLTNETIGRHVEERTRELARSREQYRLIAETTRAIPLNSTLRTAASPTSGRRRRKCRASRKPDGKKTDSSTCCCRARARRMPGSRSTNACRALSRRSVRW